MACRLIRCKRGFCFNTKPMFHQVCAKCSLSVHQAVHVAVDNPFFFGSDLFVPRKCSVRRILCGR